MRPPEARDDQGKTVARHPGTLRQDQGEFVARVIQQAGCQQNPEGDPEEKLRMSKDAFLGGATQHQGKQPSEEEGVGLQKHHAEVKVQLEKPVRKNGEQEDAQQQNADNDCHADAKESFAVRYFENHERPQQVKLFLDGQRPEMADLYRKRAEARVNVIDVDCAGEKPREVSQVSRPQQANGRPLLVQEWRGDEHEQPYEVEQGKNAQGAAHVEVAKAVVLIPVVVENSGDEES